MKYERYSTDTWSTMEQIIITDGAGCYPWTKHFAWWPVKTITGLRD